MGSALRAATASTNVRIRRVSPIAVRLGEGRLAEPRAGARSWRRGLVLVPSVVRGRRQDRRGRRRAILLWSSCIPPRVGNMEGWLLTPDTGFRPLRMTLPGWQSFLTVGQWVEPGGGLPAGLMTARSATRAICRHDQMKFAARSSGRPRIAPTDQQAGGSFRLKPWPGHQVVTSQPRERPSHVYSAYHRFLTGARPTRRVVGRRSAKSSPLRSIYCKMANGHACRRCRPDPQTLSRHARHGLRRPDRACGPVRLPRTGRGA